MSDEIKNDLKRYYNLEAQERNAGAPAEWKKRPREEFLHLVKAEQKQTLLEIGAGTGKDSSFFSENGLRVTAIDLSSEMVALCVAKGIEAYELDTYASTLNKTFDCIWSLNSLLHLDKSELPGLLGELDSVLNDNGLFYMGVYGGEDKEEYINNDAYPIHRFFSFFSDASLRKVLEEQFDIVSFEAIELDRPYHFQSVVMRKRNK